jgi:hypothetical protein
MKKDKKVLIAILIIQIFFVVLCFSIQFESMNLSVNDGSKENKNIIPNLSAGKSISLEWSCTWGGSDFDFGYGVAVDSLGNLYLAGYTYSFRAEVPDIVLIKYDGNGVLQWNRTWDGANLDYCEDVRVNSLDNVYLTGGTRSFGVGNLDMVLVKYDGNGVQQWNRTWGGTGVDMGTGIAVDSSNNIYIAGYTGSFGQGKYDMVLVKYDGYGTQQWNCTWGGDDYDWSYGLEVDSLDNVYVTGRTESFGEGGSNMALVKYDGYGIERWNCTWGGNNDEVGYGVAVDSLDNVYIAGGIGSFVGLNFDMVLVKYDGYGIEQWNRIWGGSDGDWASGVVVDSSNNVFIVGRTESFGAGDYDMVLMKYDVNGTQRESHIWGGNGGDWATGVAVDS